MLEFKCLYPNDKSKSWRTQKIHENSKMLMQRNDLSSEIKRNIKTTIGSLNKIIQVINNIELSATNAYRNGHSTSFVVAQYLGINRWCSALCIFNRETI